MPRGFFDYVTPDDYVEVKQYRHTHESTEDGSPAMLVDPGRFILMNENGDQWYDDPEYWEEI